MPHYNFNKDLPMAIQSEKEVAQLLTRLFNATILNSNNNNNKYDILAIIKGKNVTFEVKEDFTCERTNNVGLEFECRGKASGVNVSQADYYVHKLHTKKYGIIFVMQSAKSIKAKIADKKYFRIVNGGDVDSNSMNYLFKYDEFVAGGYFLK